MHASPIFAASWFLLLTSIAHAQSSTSAATASPIAPSLPNPVPNNNAAPPTDLGNITVVGQLEQARSEIVPSLGATAYTVDKDQIEDEPQGANAPFNQILLRTPGMAQDSLGQLHLRGEHANLQYRINDVLLPEGITGFGQELDPRFVDSLQLITGSLPAQYGFRTAGIVDIQTKSGAFAQGGEASLEAGSYNTWRSSVEYGGAEGKFNYYFDGSFDQNDIGIENPTPSSAPIHDRTNQFRGFTYLSYVLSDTSQLSAMAGASYGAFQIPDSPGLPTGTSPNGTQWVPGSFNSATLNENQNEQNYYGIAAYQKSTGDLNLQLAAFGRYSSVNFSPDPVGDLFFNGVAGSVERRIYSTGLQNDLSYRLNDTHTLRAGLTVLEEIAPTDSTTTVFPADSSGNPTGPAETIAQSNTVDAQFYGFYLQDEWKITPKLTLNYGFRADYYASTVREGQISPRINLIYEVDQATTLHAGYARYFTPPPLESVNGASEAAFTGTSNAPAVTTNDPVRSERSHYFDAGITHKFTPQWQVGLDGYFKIAQNQLDDGFFGQTLIPSAFNYAHGKIYGVELTTNYVNGGFSTYANAAYSVAQGETITSAQFLFDPAKLGYIQNNWVFLDHDQTVTASAGVAYTWKHDTGNTRIFMDALAGSGLRKDEELSGGGSIPNGARVPTYWTLNAGVEHEFKIGSSPLLKARLEGTNLLDRVYQLRDGSGIGVNAPQYGMRLGIFGTLSCSF